jgi:hypothetical protein
MHRNEFPLQDVSADKDGKRPAVYHVNNFSCMHEGKASFAQAPWPPLDHCMIDLACNRSQLSRTKRLPVSLRRRTKPNGEGTLTAPLTLRGVNLTPALPGFEMKRGTTKSTLTQSSSHSWPSGQRACRWTRRSFEVRTPPYPRSMLRCTLLPALSVNPALMLS